MKGRIQRNPVNVVSALLALIYMLAGTAQLISADIVVERFQVWGYPVSLVPVIGLIEVIGALALLVPSIASLGAIGLGLVMVGAVVTHIAFGSPPFAIVPLALLVALAWVAYQRLYEPMNWTLSWPRDLV
jgi:putative oxidoreductase